MITMLRATVLLPLAAWAVACTSAPSGDGNEAEIEAEARELADKADAEANRIVADIEAEAAEQQAIETPAPEETPSR